jgi:hypothetical protein
MRSRLTDGSACERAQSPAEWRGPAGCRLACARTPRADRTSGCHAEEGVVGWSRVNRCETDELARWLASPPLRWVRRSRLAQLVAGRGEALLRDQRTGASDDMCVGAALLAEWDRALSGGGLMDAAVAATAVAGLAAGDASLTVVEERAVDLTLRAGAVASDLRRLVRLRERGTAVLRGALRECVALAAATGGDADRSGNGLVWLELEDGAARGAGELLVAVLLAEQGA